MNQSLVEVPNRGLDFPFQEWAVNCVAAEVLVLLASLDGKKAWTIPELDRSKILSHLVQTTDRWQLTTVWKKYIHFPLERVLERLQCQHTAEVKYFYSWVLANRVTVER
jgi:hypothetical protein